jgi:hypothetical protein
VFQPEARLLGRSYTHRTRESVRGSRHPEGLVILAMLTAAVCEFTRPKNSSMIFGGSPAAGMTVGFAIWVAMIENYI